MPATTPANDNFGQLQVGPMVYLNNVFGLTNGASLDDVGSMSWCVPCGAQTGFRCYDLPVAGSVEDTGACKLKWELQDNIGAQGYVRAYPSVLLGSLDGRDSSWGVFAKTGCNGTAILAGSGRCTSAVYDMRNVRAATSFPMKYTEMPSTLAIKYLLDPQCGGSGTPYSNGFIDTYWHYIGDPSVWPTGYQSAWGDYNKINGRATNVWNINIWTCLPTNNPAITPWTGGSLMATRTLGGITYDVVCKHEHNPNPWNAGCAGGFFYVGFVAKPLQSLCNVPVCIYYAAIANWVASQDFKNTVLSHPQCVQIYNNLGQPPFIVDDPGNFVLAGLQAGKEIWYSDGPVESCLSGLQFVVGDEVYGKTTIETIDDCPRIVQPRPWTPGQVLTNESGGPSYTYIATGPASACIQG